MRYRSVYTSKVRNLHLNLIRDLANVTGAEYFKRISNKPKRSTLFRTVERYGGGDLALRMRSGEKQIVISTRGEYCSTFHKMFYEVQLKCPYGNLAKHFDSLGLNLRSLHSYTRSRQSEPRLIVFLSLALDCGYDVFEWVKR